MNRISKFINNTTFYFAFIIAMALPFYAKISSATLYVFIGLIFVKAIYNRFKGIERPRTSWSKSTIMLFLIPVVAIVFSESLYDSLRTLGKVLPYFLVPFSLYILNSESRKKFGKGLIKGLVLGCVLACLVLLVLISIKIYNTPDLPGVKNQVLNYYNTYYNFTDVLSKHPTYIGAEIILALIFVLRGVEIYKSRIYYIFAITSSLLFITTLIFINSRINLIILSLLAFYYLAKVFYRLYSNKKHIAFGIGVFLLATSLAVGFYSIKDSYLINRFTKELKWDLSYQKDTKFNSTTTADSRIARWYSAIKVINKKPIIGHGNNSEKRLLLEQYKKDKLKHAVSYRYDTHNTYLSYLIEYGLWGFIILISFFIIQWYNAWKSKEWSWFGFVLMIFIIGITENYLRASEGILFVSLYISFFYFQNNLNDLNE